MQKGNGMAGASDEDEEASAFAGRGKAVRVPAKCEQSGMRLETNFPRRIFPNGGCAQRSLAAQHLGRYIPRR